MLTEPVSVILVQTSKPLQAARSPPRGIPVRPRRVVCLMTLLLPMRLTVAGQDTDLVRVPSNHDKVF